MSFPPGEPFNVYDHFLGQRIAEAAGDRAAVLTEAGAWTYDEIHRASGRVANLLVEMGVEPGHRVLMSLPDGPDYVATFFGILRMGGVVVMVNPHLSAEAVAYFYDYTEPVVSLVDRQAGRTFSGALDLAEHAPAMMEVGEHDLIEGLGRLPDDAPVHPCSSEDPAVFLFSGGTTGRPKGVVQPHRSFANTTELYGKGVLGLQPDDLTLSVPKLYFGYATGSNLLFPFAAGATTALFPERCTVETLFEKIETFRPTLLVNVPTMVNHMVSHERANDADLSSLRLATSAGEALPLELHRRWDETFGVPLLDGLGTAEMWHIFISNRPDDIRPGTLGRAVDGFDVTACDENGDPVPPGEPGVMRVRGDSLALGYWKREEETREAFRDGAYVSSDMIVIDGAGYVTYAGRADDMLKVSGKWFSPRELEDCLLEHEGVGEVAVVGVRTEEGLVKPAAFVTLSPGASAGEALAEELKSWALSRLEPYKHPRTVVFMDELPRTHLGKVDRGALARRV